MAVISLALGFVMTPVARADRADELRARFEKRYPELRDLKSAGKIGETSAGLGGGG
jgi:hypothetical protein